MTKFWQKITQKDLPFGQAIKRFFRLLILNYRPSLFLTMLFTALLTFFWSGHLSMSLGAAFIGGIRWLTVGMRDKYDIRWNHFIQPLRKLTEEQRFVFYLNILGFIMMLTRCVIHDENLTTFLGYAWAFRYATRLVSMLLFVRNLWLTIFRDVQLMKDDWSLPVLLGVMPMLGYRLLVLGLSWLGSNERRGTPLVGSFWPFKILEGSSSLVLTFLFIFYFLFPYSTKASIPFLFFLW